MNKPETVHFGAGKTRAFIGFEREMRVEVDANVSTYFVLADVLFLN